MVPKWFNPPLAPLTQYRIGKGRKPTSIPLSFRCLLHDVNSQTHQKVGLRQKALPRLFTEVGHRKGSI